MSDESKRCLTEIIIDYINSRKQDRLEKFDKETEKALKSADVESVAEIERERSELRAEVEARFKPAVWLSDAASRAKQLQLVTHALKFTHSDAKGTSILANQFCGERTFVGTHSLESPEIDIVGNAAALDVGKLLMLDNGEGGRLVHYIQSNDMSPFESLAESSEQLTSWLNGFKLAITAKDPSSHKLVKQVYWPLDNGEYHLLSPLFATSMAQSLYERVHDARFSKEQKAARDARRAEAFSKVTTVEYPNLAIQAFGGTKPQNISQLNSNRGGRGYLLSSAPPMWESQDNPPLKVKSVFRGPFSRIVYSKLKGLQKFLVANLKNRSTWKIRTERARRIEDIVDSLVAYSAGVRSFPAGWTTNPECYLPWHQKLWLDPKRRELDTEFSEAFERKEWQSLVAEDFSRFLNRELEKNTEIPTGDVEFQQWKVLTAQELRLMKDDVEGALNG